MQRNQIALLGLASVITCFRAPTRSCTLGQSTRQPLSPPADSVIYLDQGWSKEDSGEIRQYYWIPQGTTVMPYDIFLNLEATASTARELFRSDANSERYGLISRPGRSTMESGWLADRAG